MLQLAHNEGNIKLQRPYWERIPSVGKRPNKTEKDDASVGESTDNVCITYKINEKEAIERRTASEERLFDY